MYDVNTFTWGMELEFGDVPRILNPPYSTWSNETDIVNTKEPYRGVAADPMGINPPVGGELNTIPTTTIEKQVAVVSQILDYFKSNGIQPTTSCVSQTHVHVHVPKLLDNLNDMKRLLIFLYKNQDTIINIANDFEVTSEMSPSAVQFFRNDNGKKYEKEKISRLISCTNLSQMIDILKHNNRKSDVIVERYFVNLLTIGTIGTIEFRCFRGTVDINLIRNILLFCESLLDAALNNKDVNYGFELPKLNYDHVLFTGWEKTKHPSSTKLKLRTKLIAI